MKMKAILAALALALTAPALAGCSTIATWTQSEQVATYDERALLTVELAYSFLLTVVLQADQMGAVSAGDAARILPVLEQVQAAVQRARSLYDAGNAVDAAVATQDAVAQITSLTALLQELGLVRRN